MLRYILKRCLQMIPTVAGVILITFILFNLVGGSPASMTLGKHVSPQSLEEFDEQRGFNKPLLFGRWTKTRAWEDMDFANSIGPWRGTPGAAYAPPTGSNPGRLVLEHGASYPIPLAFSPTLDSRYQLIVNYRLAEGGAAELQAREESKNNEIILSQWLKHTISTSVQWKTIRLSIPDGSEAGKGLLALPVETNRLVSVVPNFSLAVQVQGKPLEIRSMRLRRRMANPFDSQLMFYLRQLARLDFGMSSAMNEPVSRLLLQGIGPSLALTIPILLIELIFSVVLALVCAFFRNTLIDRFFVVFSVALMSVNYLVWIVAGQYLLAYRLHWFPLWGFESWRYLLLPVLIGVVSGLGANVRFYRTIMLDEMYRDYVRTAFAKGVSRGGMLFRHVLKNAMIPIITNVAIALPFLYTGSLLLESFFGIPGLGYLSVNALNSADIDVVRAVVLIGSILFVAANLVADICYAFVDPRVQLG